MTRPDSLATALIHEVAERLRAWEDTAHALWLRRPDSHEHLRNQADNYLALAHKLDLALRLLTEQKP